MVTIQPPIRTGRRTWLLRYSSDQEDPTFYIYIDGTLVAETHHTEYEISINIGESYIAEILEDASQLPMQVFPGKQRLNWFGFTEGDVDYYRIDEYIDSAWVERKRKKETGGYITFESRFLEDGQTHTFRIVPIGIDGNEGTAKQFAVLMVRHPDVPDVGYTYDGGTNKVTITEN